MNLYLIKRHGTSKGTYDEARGFVIAANTPNQARKMANDQGGDEVNSGTPAPWNSRLFASCKLLATDVAENLGPAVLLRDFHEA